MLDKTPTPTPPTHTQGLLPPILPLLKDQPMQWLALGFKDLARAPLLSLMHGLILAILGGFITLLAHDQFWLLVGSLSGFMVVAPVLATSLYAMSRAMEKGETVDFELLVNTWTQWQLRLRHQPDSYWSLIRFGLLLGLAATGWVITSSALITLLAPAPIHTPMDFIRHVVLAKEGHLFELWVGLGGMMAVPVFASSVISMPLLLDRRVTVLQAVLTSWKAVFTHPFQMTLWAFLILGFSLLGIFSLFLGLILVVPMLGHGSWHAYRHLVDVSNLPERITGQGEL
ncbi:hypothetical protein B9Z47_00225 [Limnohabitans sp. 2KL-1]|jgi:uncharacterized membrane protein|uniref:DUF2189 domain-containing protein n=1 Tax=Limnohabitans sp. 2KL-1 TaxID=1100699 RepID=UPI000D3A7C39|nr:DUF2189 domain-containing protein [Limnohabitans sp. 2KL-1]PUE50238.1 hypothetical protein B9Z47_00225 [Limnohabitans sp. 2KL-1]